MEKNMMLEAMIRKNPDTTVKDFMEAVNEIEGIEMFACEKMPDPEALRVINKSRLKEFKNER